MESLNRRREMGDKDDCPYQRVEYLEVNAESDGMPYIDTGYIPSYLDNEVYLKFLASQVSSENNAFVFGETERYSGNTVGSRFIYISSSKKIILDWNNIMTSNSLKFDLELNKISFLKIKNRICLFNNIQYSLPPANENNQNASLKIFNYWDESWLYQKIYKFSIGRDNTPIIDLIPVRVGNEGFMYDKVSRKLFGNIGVGKFILGPDIN